MNNSIQLYYWPTPNGWKIAIALEEMGLSYNLNLVNINKGDQFDPAFLALSPNGKMPAITDPTGPDGAPISLFESGAILQYLARKTGGFYGETERERLEVDQWLMWQMGGLGPMAGQAHHFLKYAPLMEPPHDIPYAKARYRRETGRLYGVLNARLADRDFVAGDFFSIADMAIWPWASLWQGQEQDLASLPYMARWLERCGAREALQRGRALAAEKRGNPQTDKAAHRVLFEQQPK